MDPQEHTPIDVEASAPSCPAGKAREFLRNRRVMTWASRVVVLMAWGLVAWCISGYGPLDSAWRTEVLSLGCLLVGMLTANIRFRRHQDVVPELTGDDLGLLEQFFAILQKQVTVTIRTCEAAVLEMVYRLNAELQARIKNAVQHSEILSQSPLNEAGKNVPALESLTSHQESFVEAQRQNQDRIRNVVDQVRHLKPLAVLIADISRQTEAVPYLVDLPNSMDDGMREVTCDIINALGNMQFQDGNRQVLEQVETALGSLSDHRAALYKLVGGKVPPPQKLGEPMARWTTHDVTHSRRAAHAEVERAKHEKPGQLLSRTEAPSLALAES